MPSETRDRRLIDRVYLHLRDAILEGRLVPGSPLSQRRLAEELSVSTLPVAHALHRLESDSFVESRPRAGTRVRVPSSAEIRGNYVLREALETHAARLFAELATQAERKRLREAAAALDNIYRPRSGASPGRRAEKAHVTFHLRIASAARSRELLKAIEHSRVLLFNWLFTAAGEPEPLPPDWHSRLAAVLVEGTPAEAAEAMRGHVSYRMEQIIDKFAAFRREHGAGDRIQRGPQRRTLARNGAGG